MILDQSDITWCVFLKRSRKFIGIVSIADHHEGKEKEVSYQIHPDFWGQGFAKESVARCIEYAFSVMKLDAVIAETQVKNESSIRLLERLEMKPVEKVIRFGAEQVIYRLEHSL